MRVPTLFSAAAVTASMLFVLPAAAAEIPAPSRADHARGPADAAVTVVEYGDLECPFCARHHGTMKALLAAYPEDVRWVFRHYPLPFHPNAMRAAATSECVATLEGDGAFWEFTDAVYALDTLDRADLVALAVRQGADRSAMINCLSDEAVLRRIADRMDAAEQAGVEGTPANFIFKADGTLYATKPGAYPYEDFVAIVDAALAGNPAPPDFEAPVAEPDAWEDTSDELPPVTAGDHLYGRKDAPVTVVEYGDIECPFCARAHRTMKAVVRKNRGQVNWVYRHYPLSFHKNALPAAEAAECVAELKGNAAFWSFIDRLYVKQDKLSASFAASAAQRLKVDGTKYKTCLQGDKHLKTIKAQMDGGTAAGVNGTPAFYVVDNRTGEIAPISGAQPEEAFQATIDLFLKK